MDGYIYFIQQSQLGHVKIGYTKDNPFYRLRDLQVGSSAVLTIVGCIKGDGMVEKTIHKMMGHLRLRGEWFSKDVLKILPTLNPIDLELLKKESEPILKKDRTPVDDSMLFFHYNLSTKLHGKNLSEIARTLKIPKSLVADWVADRRTPSGKNMHYVKKIADYLNLSLEQLFFEKSN